MSGKIFALATLDRALLARWAPADKRPNVAVPEGLSEMIQEVGVDVGWHRRTTIEFENAASGQIAARDVLSCHCQGVSHADWPKQKQQNAPSSKIGGAKRWPL
jgi:hypothetical protein